MNKAESRNEVKGKQLVWLPPYFTNIFEGDVALLGRWMNIISTAIAHPMPIYPARVFVRDHGGKKVFRKLEKLGLVKVSDGGLVADIVDYETYRDGPEADDLRRDALHLSFGSEGVS